MTNNAEFEESVQKFCREKDISPPSIISIKRKECKRQYFSSEEAIINELRTISIPFCQD